MVIFSAAQPGPGAHPASCTMGGGSFPGVKRPGRRADNPPPSNTGLRMGLSYNLASPLYLHRRVFTFCL
jgi:hypothetical protein